MRVADFEKRNQRFRPSSIATKEEFRQAIRIDAMIAAPINPKAATVGSAQMPSEDEVRQRIAALKARKSVATPSRDDFHFDPSQPLKLIAREKLGSGK